MKTFTTTINGEEWAVRFVPPSKMPKTNGKPDWGCCDFGKRTISINSKLSPIDTLLTLEHEHDHANHPNFAEPAVARIDDERKRLIELAGLEITRRATN